MQRIFNMFLRLPSLAQAALLCVFLMAFKMTDILPRNQNLPLFKPHVPDFTCEIEASKVPPIDAQAEAWFLEARALESPDIYIDDRDYKKIVQLTRQAAERHHWKAMLNLASLYLKGHDPDHNTEDAVQLVEAAMRLGIPAAYDRMGTYFHNGTGVNGDATRAYAFWQKAAEMGNPQAMTFLADKIAATWDSPQDRIWANIPVATKMLECAFGQGYGPAAYHLHYLYEYQRAPNGEEIGDHTFETKARALKVLHEGVKLGCSKCARNLYVEFGSPFDLADMLAPFIDKARAERYGLLQDAIDFNPDLRFPNLDKVLPLPPADLPPWNGDEDTLINAAMGVSLPKLPPKPSAASTYTDRHFVDAAFRLHQAEGQPVRSTTEAHAPLSGYWQPSIYESTKQMRAPLSEPGLYGQGEAFEQFYRLHGNKREVIADVLWERWDVVKHHHEAIAPQAAPGLTREVAQPESLISCAGGKAAVCPVSGIWQPWVHPDHPLQAIVNQHWRQSWLKKGRAFPRPQQDWLLALLEKDVTWYLMEGTAVDIG